MTIESDPANKRTFSMWKDCGMQFRGNTVAPGGRIPLHAHNYDHVAAVWGAFALTTTDRDGVTATRRVDGGIVSIPAGVKHLFEFLGSNGYGSVTCFWPIGHDKAPT